MSNPGCSYKYLTWHNHSILLLQVEVLLHVSNNLMIVNKVQTELTRLTPFVLAEYVISTDLKTTLNYRNVKKR